MNETQSLIHKGIQIIARRRRDRMLLHAAMRIEAEIRTLPRCCRSGVVRCRRDHRARARPDAGRLSSTVVPAQRPRRNHQAMRPPRARRRGAEGPCGLATRRLNRIRSMHPPYEPEIALDQGPRRRPFRPQRNQNQARPTHPRPSGIRPRGNPRGPQFTGMPRY